MGFTIVSITLSLIAVFLPILLMGGIVGRLFREFAVTLSLAILVSMAISLTTTPMLCALFLKPQQAARRIPPGSAAASASARRQFYGRTLAWTLHHNLLVLAVLLATVAAERHAAGRHPQGLLPDPGHGAADRQPAGRPEHLVPGDEPAS